MSNSTINPKVIKFSCISIGEQPGGWRFWRRWRGHNRCRPRQRAWGRCRPPGLPERRWPAGRGRWMRKGLAGPGTAGWLTIVLMKERSNDRLVKSYGHPGESPWGNINCILQRNTTNRKKSRWPEKGCTLETYLIKNASVHLHCDD